MRHGVRAGELFLLGALALACLLGARAPVPGAAPAPPPPSGPEFYLYTVSPGTTVFERWGHTILCRIEASQQVCFDFGVFAEDQADQVVRLSLTGQPAFAVQRLSLQRAVERYAALDRTVWRQHLPLGHQQTAALSRALESRVGDNYAYHPFRRNCSTEVRDLIDQASGGRLAEPGDSQPHERAAVDPRTYRDYAREGFSGRVLALAGVTLFVGGAADQHLAPWQRAFMPVELSELVGQRLGAESELVYEQKLEPLPTSPAAGDLVLLLGSVLTASLLAWALRRSWGRWPLRVWGYSSALVGITALALAAYSVYPEARSNWMPLLYWPTDAALGHLRAKASLRYLMARLVGVAALLAASASGWIAQPLIVPALVVGLPLLAAWRSVSRGRLASWASLSEAETSAVGGAGS